MLVLKASLSRSKYWPLPTCHHKDMEATAGKMEIILCMLQLTNKCRNKRSSISPLSGDVKREDFGPSYQPIGPHSFVCNTIDTRELPEK